MPRLSVDLEGIEASGTHERTDSNPYTNRLYT
jgi:hypothetical protein